MDAFRFVLLFLLRYFFPDALDPPPIAAEKRRPVLSPGKKYIAVRNGSRRILIERPVRKPKVLRIVRTSATATIPSPLPSPEPTSPVPARDESAEVLKLLPDSLGVARFFFVELWRRCGNAPGELGSVTLQEMSGWSADWSIDRIRHYLKKLSSPEFGFVVVENGTRRGEKRILVNRPTRIVREMPLFDFAAEKDRCGDRGEVRGNCSDCCEPSRDCSETRETVSETKTNAARKTPQSPLFSAHAALPPSFAELERKRQAGLAMLAESEKNSNFRNQERSNTISIKNNQEDLVIKKSRIQEPTGSVILTSRPGFSKSPESPKVSIRTKTPPSNRNGPIALADAVGLAAASALKPRKNTPGMRIEREEVISFVKQHHDAQEGGRGLWLLARRVAVCVVDLENQEDWERWKERAIEAKSFNAYCIGFMKRCCKQRGMDMNSIDEIGKEIFNTGKRR